MTELTKSCISNTLAISIAIWNWMAILLTIDGNNKWNVVLKKNRYVLVKYIIAECSC